jgi:hypothetical protein
MSVPVHPLPQLSTFWALNKDRHKLPFECHYVYLINERNIEWIIV